LHSRSGQGASADASRKGVELVVVDVDDLSVGMEKGPDAGEGIVAEEDDDQLRQLADDVQRAVQGVVCEAEGGEGLELGGGREGWGVGVCVCEKGWSARGMSEEVRIVGAVAAPTCAKSAGMAPVSLLLATDMSPRVAALLATEGRGPVKKFQCVSIVWSLSSDARAASVPVKALQ
jgi:hypothetical protein